MCLCCPSIEVGLLNCTEPAWASENERECVVTVRLKDEDEDESKKVMSECSGLKREGKGGW